MEELIFYSLPGDQFVESYDPRCIAVHRILNFKKFSYQLKIVSPPEEYQKFEKAIVAFPIIYYNRQIIHDAIDMIKVLSQLNPDRLIITESIEENPYQLILTQWAIDSMSLILNYFMFSSKKNWERFLDEMIRSGSNKKVIKVLSNEKEVATHYLQRTFLNRYDYQGVVNLFDEQLRMINSILTNKKYLTGDKITIADFSVFSTLHMLFHPYITEGRAFEGKYPYLESWAKKIDRETSGEFTKKFNIK